MITFQTRKMTLDMSAVYFLGNCLTKFRSFDDKHTLDLNLAKKGSIQVKVDREPGVIDMKILLFVLFALIQRNEALTKRASLTYKHGEVQLLSDKGKNIVLEPGTGGRVKINGPVDLMNGAFTRLKLNSASGQRCTHANRGVMVYRDSAIEVCDGFRFVSMRAKLGSVKNPASSCKAILDDDWSASSGVYHIKTHSTITKVYCYMENIPGCGGGGWTTVMKTNGHLPTFKYFSSYWTNKKSYHVTGGQSGEDHQETKLPTYWTTPFSSLCLGMKSGFQRNANWVRVNYKAKSLYSVIADSRYRGFSIGRSKWKALVPGSSLQRNCNREGFNNNPAVKHYSYLSKVRIGIVSNNENECQSPDSRIGFGGTGEDKSVFTGNKAAHGGDAGDKFIKTFGYILVQ